MNSEDAAAIVWRNQAEWSAAASKLKSELSRWRLTILAALVIGALLGAVALQFDDGSAAQRGAAVAGAVVLALVPVIRTTKLSKAGVSEWTRARSASEALKHEVYAHATCTGRYRSKETRSPELLGAKDAILDRVKDLAPRVATIRAVDRFPPQRMSLDAYLEFRVGDQAQNYYRPRASEYAESLQRLRNAEFVLALAGAALLAIAAFGGWSFLAAWIGAFTTTAGALTAHREAARFEPQVISYRATARRLESLRAHWSERLANGDLSPGDEDQLVAECEAAISVENQSWMAAWIDEPATPS